VTPFLEELELSPHHPPASKASAFLNLKEWSWSRGVQLVGEKAIS